MTLLTSIRWPLLIVSTLATALAVVVAATPAMAASAVVEGWTGTSQAFHPVTSIGQAAVVKTPGALDGKALKLTLPAYAQTGPNQGIAIASNTSTYRYGTYGTRMKTADCTGQDHPGVVTGTFTYATDHSDANKNGIADNDEIDVEFLCGQPDVIWMTLWTDYSETSDNLGSVTRTVNLRTGQVLSTCYLIAYAKPCQPALAGENSPARVTAVPGFDSAKQFYTYMFDWQPARVTFYSVDNLGRRNVLWDYRGPATRIPHKPSMFMQNVWHTANWNPLNGPSHNQTTASTSAYIDATYLPN
jgi:beta-glucanase (GH16 family)